MNRGDDEEVESTNVNLARRLVRACHDGQPDNLPRIVYANSIHIDRDSAYASGKRAAADIFTNSAGMKFFNVVLPNLFGEFGRPFYNSVVSTFCQQLESDVQPELHQNATLNLLHVQRAAEALVGCAIEEADDGEIRPQGSIVDLQTLLCKLQNLHESYSVLQIVPKLETAFDRELFNTLRSYRPLEKSRIALQPNRDDRGVLIETVKSDGISQTFVSSTHSGVTRGNHYHTRKFERFIVCSGEAEISLRRLFSEHVVTFRVFGDEPCAVDIPTFCTHNITNVGDQPLITQFWTNEIFDMKDRDTFPEQVIL